MLSVKMRFTKPRVRVRLYSDAADGYSQTPSMARTRAPISIRLSNLQGQRHRSVLRLTWLFQHLPLAKTVDDYDALLLWKMPADLR
jgi:hypothetical protein